MDGKVCPQLRHSFILVIPAGLLRVFSVRNFPLPHDGHRI